MQGRALIRSKALLRRLRDPRGFGLIELVIAMGMLAVGIASVGGLFVSGHVVLRRATQNDAAAVIADRLLERFRAETWSNVALSSTLVAAADSTYAGDAALSGGRSDLTEAQGATSATACTGSNVPIACNPSRAIPDTAQTPTEAAPDGRPYRIDTYVTWGCPDPSEVLGGTVASPTCTLGGAVQPYAAVKVVTIVIRDATSSSTLTAAPVYRTSTSFDRLSGGSMPTVTASPTTTGTTTTTTTTTSTTTTTPASAPSPPNSVAFANGAGAGAAYIDSGNAGSLSFDVVLPTGSAATDLVFLTVADGDPSHTQTLQATGTQGAGTVHFTGINGQAFSDGTITFGSYARNGNGSSATTSATATKDTLAPSPPTAVALQNGQGAGGAYVNAATKASVAVDVGLGASSVATDTVSVTIASGAQTSAAATAPASSGAGTATVTGIVATALADGTVTASATVRDAAGNASATTTASFSKDTVAPTLSGIASANKVGGTLKKAEAGDTVTLTFSEAILAASVPASSNATITTANGNGKPVQLALPNLAGAAFQIGTSGSGGYLAQNGGPAQFSGSALSQPSSTQVRSTFGTCTGSCGDLQVGGAVNVAVGPDSGLTDVAGNPVGSTTLSATAVSFF